ncbi:MAG: extracellular solute-binding protein [Bacteroidota bacterium]
MARNFLVSLALLACNPSQNDENRIVIWHQMRPDEQTILHRQLQRYMDAHPGVMVVEVYKETEQLRSGYVVAAIAGQGPDLVHGPSDPVGIYEATKTIMPLETLFDEAYLSEFDSSGLLWYKGHLYQIADKIGNHLALLYNKKYIKTAPTTDLELIEVSLRIQNQHGFTGGRPNVYGISWNYIEPFFFIPFYTGFGGWVFESDGITPSLDNDAMVQALRFVGDLRDKFKIVPNEADYEIADALFKDGKAAMLINGDWSWRGYQQKGIDLGVAPLPRITATGLWCAPMTSPKGYSLNSGVQAGRLGRILDVLTFLLSAENQLETALELSTAPTRKSLYEKPEIRNNEILRNSLLQIDRGRPMPVVPEMRAVWDAMRPGYQAVMGGAMTPEAAAAYMEALAVQKIREMNE